MDDPDSSVVVVENALRATTGFANWPAEPMALLRGKSRLRSHRRGLVFAYETDQLPETLCVVSGNLMGEREMADGSVAAVGLIGRGNVVGLSQALLRDARPGYRYRAHDDAVVIHIPSDYLLELLNAQPVMWRDMAQMLLRQKREMQSAVITQTTGALHVRLAATIERLARLYGKNDGDTTVVRLRITQEDLAALLQVTRPTISRALKALELAGLIRVRYNTLIILDRAGLRKMAA